jgi:rubrerythrin
VVKAGGDAESPEEFAGKAWAFRHAVERDATMRFGRMARRLERIGTPAHLVKLAEKASNDEERHMGYCADLADKYGAKLRDEPLVPSEIAPARLRPRQRVLYEVAATCVAETESTHMLVTLMGAAKKRAMRSLLREFSRDEVTHARMGWAVLASHKDSDDLSFLAKWIPWMLSTTAGDSFAPHRTGIEDPSLYDHGVLPYSVRRRVFIQALDDVIFPGLEALGVDSGPSRAWLARIVG